jgi:hypothetical protein
MKPCALADAERRIILRNRPVAAPSAQPEISQLTVSSYWPGADHQATNFANRQNLILT